MSRFINKVTFDRIDAVLKSGAIAVQGQVACANPATGKVEPASTTAGLKAIGFWNNPDGDVTGDGTSTVNIQLFEEVTAYKVSNDTTHPLTQPYGLAHMLDGQTVTADATGEVSGFVWQVDPKGVTVEFAGEI